MKQVLCCNQLFNMLFYKMELLSIICIQWCALYFIAYLKNSSI